MSYKDKDLERATTRKRVKKHRAKQKAVTEGVTCPLCGGRGFTEHEHGLMQVQCECQVKS